MIFESWVLNFRPKNSCQNFTVKRLIILHFCLSVRKQKVPNYVCLNLTFYFWLRLQYADCLVDYGFYLLNVDGVAKSVQAYKTALIVRQLIINLFIKSVEKCSTKVCSLKKHCFIHCNTLLTFSDSFFLLTRGKSKLCISLARSISMCILCNRFVFEISFCSILKGYLKCKNKTISTNI